MGRQSQWIYNRSMKLWLEKNDIKMYSTHNEWKSVFAERFIRTSKTKMYQYMTTKSKIVSIDKLVDNNAYDSTIKMKPVYVKDNRYIDSSKKGNNKDPKFKAGYHVRISKHKSHFAKRYTPNSSEEDFVIKKFKSTVPWIYAINDLNGEEIVRTFIKKNCKK